MTSECSFESWDIILFNHRNFETAGYHATNLERGNSICGFFKKRVFTIKYCVGAPEHVRTFSILYIIMFKHQRTQKQTLETHCWPISADFDFWKFWPTNENLKKLKNAKLLKSTSKSPMRTLEKVLESFDIIFFYFEILGTTWVPFEWHMCMWNT